MTQPLEKLITESRCLRTRRKVKVESVSPCVTQGRTKAPSTHFMSVRWSMYASDTGKSPACFFCRRAKRGPHREGIIVRIVVVPVATGRVQIVGIVRIIVIAGPQPGADKTFAPRIVL